MQNLSEDSPRMTAIKLSAAAVVVAALGLWVCQQISDLPTIFDSAGWRRIVAIANAALVIHAIEGIIAAILTFRSAHLSEHSSDRLSRVKIAIQTSLYVFLVGTVGLSEIIRANKDSASAIDTLTEQER